MPTATYTPLANITLGSSASSVTFSSIPNTYRDLVVVVRVNGLGGDPASRNASVLLNGTRGVQVWVYGASGVVASGTESLDVTLPFGNYRNYAIMNIMDYSATDKHKTILTRAGSPNNVEWIMVGRTTTTSAVTSVELLSPDSGADVWISGSTFALYGIVA